jgi:hypothetical protein
MSLLSRITRVFSRTPHTEQAAPDLPHESRHDRREAGRERHHRTGEPAWEASDRLDQPSATDKNPDAAPEILGGG